MIFNPKEFCSGFNKVSISFNKSKDRSRNYFFKRQPKLKPFRIPILKFGQIKHTTITPLPCHSLLTALATQFPVKQFGYSALSDQTDDSSTVENETNNEIIHTRTDEQSTNNYSLRLFIKEQSGGQRVTSVEFANSYII